jgi:hypothetical protein
MDAGGEERFEKCELRVGIQMPHAFIRDVEL